LIRKQTNNEILLATLFVGCEGTGLDFLVYVFKLTVSQLLHR